MIFILLSAAILIRSASGQGFTKAEYFFDADPGVGSGITLSTPVGTSDTINFSAGVSIAALSTGFHFMAIRILHNNGTWSLFEKRGFYVSSAAIDAANIVAAEYFFDADPGVGNGIATTIGVSAGAVNFTAVIPTALLAGFHFLAIRTKGVDGIWGLYEKKGFYVSQSTGDMPILTNAEYFFDADPGVGNANALTVNSPGNTFSQTFTVPVPNGISQGQHFLAIRIKDQSGNWGLFEFQPILVAGAVTVTGLLLNTKKEGSAVKVEWYNLTEINTRYYEIERSPNGIDFQKIGEVQASGNSSHRSDYSFTDLQPYKNLNYYRLKQVDRDGRVVYSDVRLIRFGKEKQFSVYPVITQGSFRVDGIIEVVNIRLFNSVGQLVQTQVSASATSVDISGLPRGMYWLVIDKKGEVEFVQKIVKE